MGNQTYYGKSVETFMLKYLPQLSYKTLLKDAQLYKTILCTIDDEGPVVCKFHFQKIEGEEFKMLENDMNKIKSTFSLYKHPNVLVYDKICNLGKKALMGMRQFVCHNLNEKLHRIPKLQLIEKKWITFQLLCGVSQIHAEKMVHGDIKPDNIMLTSYSWLFITDQVPYKPAFLRHDDLKAYNAYFGELDNNLRCYIAPERFKTEWDDSYKDVKLLEPSMDIFSIGCVIAEIFMDGHPLFGLAQLQNYWKGIYDPTEDLAKKIKDQKIVDLIISMIDKDPSERLTVNQYIQRWNDIVFPRCFHQVYFQIGSSFLRPQYLFSDSKIGLIRKYINAIWFVCFGKQNGVVTDSFNEPVDVNTFERLRDDSISQQQDYLIPSNELFVFLNKQNLILNYQTEGAFAPSQDDKDGIIVIIHYIGCLIQTCFYPQNKICALEMLFKIAINSSIEMRLQFILPYVIAMLEDENSKVKGKAIEVIVMMFAEVLDQGQVTTLTATDYKVFDNYILPAFLKLKNEATKDQDQYVQYVFVRYLPLLAQIGHRFLELSVGSRFQKRQQVIKNNTEKNIMSLVEESNKEEEEEKWGVSNESVLQASTTQYRGRGTIIIRDDQVNSDKPNKIQDAMEVFVNYDTEYDKLRRIVLSIINDILSETEHTLQRILFQELGRLSVFLGRKMSIDNLIPLLNSCFNKKDFMLRRECLRGIPYLGLTVGQQTLARYLLITCTQLLYDSEESVVFEMVKALTRLLEFKLISKQDAFENLDRLLPLLLHPNTWIREETINYIKFLADPKNEILTPAETYCLVRPKIKKYLNKNEKVYQIHGSDLCLAKLKPPLSREIYEREIKGSIAKKIDASVQDSLSESDKFALEVLAEVLQNAKTYYQSFKREKMQNDIEVEYNEDFIRKFERTKVYRILQNSTLQQLAGIQSQGPNFSPLKKKATMDQNDGQVSNEILSTIMDSERHQYDQDQDQPVIEYCDTYYQSALKVKSQDIERINYGLNKRVLNNLYPLTYEIDIILQALNLVPQDPDIPIVAYKNLNKFTALSNQSLILNSNLYLEASSEQPQILPQYHQGSKKIPIQVNQNSSQLYTLGQARTKLHTWRPTGRLVTTLYEHKGPVNCLAISDDNQLFITGSKSDQSINIWSTSDIEKDVTSHSLFSIKTQRQINAITTIDNSAYFAVAGSQGCIDIFQVGRLDQQASSSLTSHNSVLSTFKNTSIDKNLEYNHTSIIKTLEKKDQGDITHCANMILPIQQQHLLSYVSQRGSLYFHDLRARYDVMNQHELFGSQKGLVTSMTIGQDPYQLYFGTLGGYVMVYDVRYNVISQQYKHFQRTAINSVVPFCPSKQQALNLIRVDNASPLALISTGTQHYELSLVNLYTSDVEIFLTVDDSKVKDNIQSFTPVVPQFYKENLIEGTNGPQPRKYETNSSLFRRYLQSNRNSQYFNSIMSYQQQSLIKNLDEEWLKNSKNRYMLVKAAYESKSACKKILVPRKYNSILQNTDTVSYAITGGNDKKIRYWDFLSLQKKSYYVNTPQDDECQYYAENLGDTYVVQEKVNQFKQFPQLTAQLATKQFDGVLPTANLSLAGNNTCKSFVRVNSERIDYGIIGSIMQGQDQVIADGGINAMGQSNNNGIRSSSFQYEAQGDQTTIYNYNGLAEWQHFNGLALNSACGVHGQVEAATGNVDYFYRESENVSHSDCILDMGIVEIGSQEPILITCGRDSKIKLWR